MNFAALGLRALNKLGILKHITFTGTMVLSGKRTKLPMVKGVGFAYVLDSGHFMEDLLRVLIPLFPGTFVDVGVNIGQTLIKLRSAWPDVPYVGFEPNPVCVDYTERLIAANGYRNASIIPAALTDEDGDGSLLLWQGDDPDDSTATLIKDFRAKSASEKEIPVRLVRWRSFEIRSNPAKLGVVKVDVEGGELEVLVTMQARINSDRPVVVVEVLPTYDPPKRMRSERQRGIERMAAACELRIFRIHKGDRSISLEALTEFGISNDLRTADHLLVPAERVSEVIAAFSAGAFT